MYPKARRRLAQWIDEQGVTKYGIRFQPSFLKRGTFGYESGDPAAEKANVEMSIGGLKGFIAFQIASFAVDVPGALAFLPFAFFMNNFLSHDNWYEFYKGYEAGWGTNPQHKLTWPVRLKSLFGFDSRTHGISGVNGLAHGYLLYHGIFGAPKLWMPLVGGAAGVGGSLIQSISGMWVNNFAHLGGAAYGFLFAFLVHRFWRKKTRGVGFLQRYDVIFTILCVLLIVTGSNEEKTKYDEYEKKKRKEELTEMVEMEPSEISLRQKRCDEKVADSEDSTEVDNLSLSEFSELDIFGYPRYDPRIDGSRKGSNWYQPKKVYVGLDKHGKGVYKDPSIGSSGELDRLSLGPSRSTPENQPAWSYHTRSTDSIVIPKLDDARYY